jgi:putative two-component system response regulator
MEKRVAILVVDDEEANRKSLSMILETFGYRAFQAENGKRAVEMVAAERIDVILLDLMMPVMNGFEVCRTLKANPSTRNIPIVVVTAVSDDSNHLNALKAGADDFLPKPYNIHLLKARLRSLVQMKMLYDMNVDYRAKLEKDNTQLMQELIKTQDATIFSLAKLAEFRDPETGDHLERMRQYGKLLTESLRRTSRYSTYISDRYINNIFKSMPLHDIGKVGIQDNILLKPGKLTSEEFDIMKTHTTIGGDAIRSAIQVVGRERSFLTMGMHIAYYHHERWDGKGYPKGIAADNIPLSARVSSIADVYDALTSVRVYKDALPHEKACDIILEGRGTQFDPDLVDVFEKNEEDFARIKTKYRDKTESDAPAPIAG